MPNEPVEVGTDGHPSAFLGAKKSFKSRIFLLAWKEHMDDATIVMLSC